MSENTGRTMPPGAAPAQRTARQRRPTGTPPPLPHPFTISTTAWLVLAVLIVACAFVFTAHTPWLGLDDRANAWFLRLLAEVRTPWLTDLAEGIKAVGGGWGVTALGLSVVLLTRGKAAHVDVGGRRGDAIRLAVRDQLGLTVLEVKPVGLESSAGSTPLRLRVEGGPDEYVFAKLYTKGHVRADRWYKLWRTILYGSLCGRGAPCPG